MRYTGSANPLEIAIMEPDEAVPINAPAVMDYAATRPTRLGIWTPAAVCMFIVGLVLSILIVLGSLGSLNHG